MLDTFFIKRGDTGPDLQRQLLDESGNPLNLSSATVRFNMQLKGGAVAISRAAATIVNASTGIVKYSWQAGDTDTAGSYEGEFEITYPDSSVETVPNYGMIEITISADIA